MSKKRPEVSDEEHEKRMNNLIDHAQLKRNMRYTRTHSPDMTLAAMERVTGATSRTIRRYDDENDPSMIDALTFLRQCRYFGLSADYVSIMHEGNRSHMDNEVRLREIFQWILAHATDEQKSGMVDYMIKVTVPGIMMVTGMYEEHANVLAKFGRGRYGERNPYRKTDNDNNKRK